MEREHEPSNGPAPEPEKPRREETVPTNQLDGDEVIEAEVGGEGPVDIVATRARVERDGRSS